MDCAVHARGGATPAGPLSPFALTLTGRIIVVVVSKEAHEIRHAAFIALMILSTSRRSWGRSISVADHPDNPLQYLCKPHRST
jgi:hypothetical protein